MAIPEFKTIYACGSSITKVGEINRREREVISLSQV
jgi:hypothetical protein